MHDLNPVKILTALKNGNAKLLLVKGLQIFVHVERTMFCPDTGAPQPRRDVYALDDLAQAASNAEDVLEQVQQEVDAWEEILRRAVKAPREGDYSQDLKDKEVHAVIEAARKKG